MRYASNECKVILRSLIYFSGLFFIIKGYCQNQEKADSAKIILLSEKDPFKRAALIRILDRHEQNRDTIIKYELELVDLILEHDLNNLDGAYMTLGSAYAQKGYLSQALNYFQLGLEVAITEKDKGILHSNIASLYQNNSDFERARYHYSQGLDIFRKLEDNLRQGTTLVSIGYLEYLDGKFDHAIEALEEGKKIFEDTAIAYNDYYWSYAAGNLALALASNQDISESEQQMDTVMTLLKKYQDEYAQADYLTEMSKIYLRNGLTDKALKAALHGNELSIKHDYRKYLRDVNEVLSKIYSDQGDFKKAYDAYQIHIANKDSLMNADLIRQLANQRTEFEVGQKQAEVDVLTAEKKTQQVVLWSIGGFAFILIVLASIIYKYYRTKNRIAKILAEQKEELENLNSTKDRFFSIISHDLRGPVSAFHGVSRLIKYFVKSKNVDSLIEIADEMEHTVDQLSSLLDNLLNWAMQQQGNFPNVPEKVDLKEIAEEQVNVFTNTAKGKEVTLKSEIESTIHLWADKNMTTTILRNLVNNSLKFTPAGGSVMLQAEESDGSAIIRVKDTGVGMSQDKVDGLFELKERKRSYGTSGEKGLGLGLQLVKDFLKMNNGSIEVISEPGVGTEFILTLPLFDPKEDKVTA